MTATPSPEEWLATFDATIAEVKARTTAFQRDLEQAGATESAENDSLSVTVVANGALTGLRIDDHPELAEQILRLTQKAQRTAAANVAAAFAPLGADAEAMRMFTAHLP